MAWAQSLPGAARLNLAQSGVSDVVADDTPWPEFNDALSTAPLCDRGPSGRQIHTEFLAAVARRYDVTPNEVVPSLGASLSIMHTLMALVRPGDRVLVEQPAYEALYRAPAVLGAEIVRIPRRATHRWQIDPDELEGLLTENTKCVLLTNLHNPSGMLLERSLLEDIGERCAKRGVFVLVDEVYLDFVFDIDEKSCAVPATKVLETGISWSSSTKCFGVSAARAGWIVTQHKAALAAIKDASRYLHVEVPVATSLLGHRVLTHADALTARARRHSEAGLKTVEAWTEKELRVLWNRPDHGLCGVLQLPRGTDAMSFVDELLANHGTLVVPGDLFECPGTVRLGFGCPTAELEEGLGTISAALDALKR